MEKIMVFGFKSSTVSIPTAPAQAGQAQGTHAESAQGAVSTDYDAQSVNNYLSTASAVGGVNHASSQVFSTADYAHIPPAWSHDDVALPSVAATTHASSVPTAHAVAEEYPHTTTQSVPSPVYIPPYEPYAQPQDVFAMPAPADEPEALSASHVHALLGTVPIEHAVEHADVASDLSVDGGTDDVADLSKRFAQLEARCAALEKKNAQLEKSAGGAVVPSFDHHEGHRVDVSMLKKQPLDMGVLQPLLNHPKITDIMVNSPDKVFAEVGGVMQLTDVKFASHEDVLDLAERIARSSGRVLDSDHLLVDARLPDGSRVNIVAPPLALEGISISIRKFGGASITLDSMAKGGALTQQAADFLKLAARSKANIIVSGGTGTGKTTLLNSLSKYIGDHERVVTIEDSAELQLQQPHVVRLEASQGAAVSSDRRGGVAISIRELVKNALRMRPERIVVGESRGPEAFDMVQAMNTGHDGSFTTIHANTPRDVVARLENMIGMANLGMPLIAIRKQIASAVHIIIQTARMDDGTRRITHITEVVGMEGDMITMQDIFLMRNNGVDAQGRVQTTMAWEGTFPRHKALNIMVREANILRM
jgi:pilus assembly protein CpaF